MKERPIPFSGKMVGAILEGRKTQTRRVIKPQPTLNFHYHGWYMKDAYEWTTCHPLEVRHPKSQRQVVRCPYGVPGDRLWVREKIDGVMGCDAVYCADYARLVDAHPNGWDVWRDGRRLPLKTISPIHMPRWASRITLELTNVRVQRVQDISEEDAKAEGVDGGCINCGQSPCEPRCIGPLPGYRDSFAGLWNVINAKRGFGWIMNPWVWVLKFQVFAGKGVMPIE